MAAVEFDWPRLALEAATSLLSAMGGLVVGAWKWGRNSALNEQKLRDEAKAHSDELSEEITAAMAALRKELQDKVDEFVDQSRETLNGIRRQIDDDRLSNEKQFVRKDDFNDFRKEYREDMRDVKAAIARIVR